jgi:RNA polymerase sigma-70 factor (ECF subfamily)
LDEGHGGPPHGDATLEERWRALIDQYGRYLRNVIARHCPRHLGVQFDDVEQEARLRLWKALARERKIDDPASYLYRIAATATIDAVRRVRAKREEALEPEGAADGAPGPARLSAADSSLERSTARRLLVQRVATVLERWPAERRLLLNLHLQGFTTQEIAQQLGWTEPKARNLVYRTLRELRESLRAEGVEYEGD